MFTGIIEDVGEIKKVSHLGAGVRISVETKLDLILGDSIAVDGMCLTIEDLQNGVFTAFLSKETLSRTSFSFNIREGFKVNLERPLTPSSPMGGHLLLGHIDSTGEIYSRELNFDGGIFIFKLKERKYVKYLVEKGSVAINGISLTCFDIGESTFKVAVIPYTIQHTTLRYKKEGSIVNLEFDIVAKYIEKLINKHYDSR